MLTALLTQFQTDKQLSLFNTHTHTHTHIQRTLHTIGPPALYSKRNDRIPPAKQLTLPYITNSNTAINIGQPIVRTYRQSACKH
jgi:hypothetical protein